jgi:hypothetical protein
VWCGDVADLVEPLYHLMADRVRASHVVAMLRDSEMLPFSGRVNLWKSRFLRCFATRLAPLCWGRCFCSSAWLRVVYRVTTPNVKNRTVRPALRQPMLPQKQSKQAFATQPLGLCTKSVGVQKCSMVLKNSQLNHSVPILGDALGSTASCSSLLGTC